MFRRSTNGAASSSSSSSTSFLARPVRNSIRPPHAKQPSRAEHIQSYLSDPQLAPSTRKVSPDDSTHDTVFQSVSGDTLIVRVHWPASAVATSTGRPPVMTLAGVEANHEWLDRRMVVTGYAPLQSLSQWNESGLLLGAAVHAVIQHLQLHPPQIVRFVDQGLIQIQSKPPANHGASSANASRRGTSNHHHDTAKDKTNSSHSGSSHSTSGVAPPSYSSFASPPSPPPPPPVHVDLPTIPSHFDEHLDSMDRTQLEALQSDELALRALFNRLPIAADYHTLQKSVGGSNAATAADRLEQHESTLQALHQRVLDQQTELEDKKTAFAALEAQQDAVCKLPDRRKVCRDLAKAKKEAFDVSERLADQWLATPSGDGCAMAMQDFCASFLEARQVHHRRAATLELLERQNNNER